MAKSTKTFKNNRTAKQVIIGAALSVAALILCSMLSAAILITRDNPTGEVGIYALLTLIASAVISGALVPKFTDGIPRGLICASSTAAIILVSGIIAGGGLSFASLMNCLCYISLFALTGALIKMKKGKAKHRRIHRR